MCSSYIVNLEAIGNAKMQMQYIYTRKIREIDKGGRGKEEEREGEKRRREE